MSKEQLNRISEIFIDTSAYIALVRSADDNHNRALEMAKDLSQFPIQAYTTNFILAETHAFDHHFKQYGLLMLQDLI